jgi:hypothetical protein
MMNIINLRQTCSLPSKGRVGVGWGHSSYIVSAEAQISIIIYEVLKASLRLRVSAVKKIPYRTTSL